MKILGFFLALVCCANGYSDDAVQKIYERASEIVENNHSETSDEKLLFQFYSKEIAGLDLETLKNNPELVFRKGDAWFQSLGDYDSFQDLISQLTKMQADYQFVLDHSEKESMLHKASLIRKGLLSVILESPLENEEAPAEKMGMWLDGALRLWATNPLAIGKALREDVFLNVQQNSSIAASFYDFLILIDENPDIALGYIKPDVVKVVGIVPDESGKDSLLCRVEYRTKTGRCTSDTGF